MLSISQIDLSVNICQPMGHHNGKSPEQTLLEGSALTSEEIPIRRNVILRTKQYARCDFVVVSLLLQENSQDLINILITFFFSL